MFRELPLLASIQAQHLVHSRFLKIIPPTLLLYQTQLRGTGHERRSDDDAS